MSEIQLKDHASAYHVHLNQQFFSKVLDLFQREVEKQGFSIKGMEFSTTDGFLEQNQMVLTVFLTTFLTTARHICLYPNDGTKDLERCIRYIKDDLESGKGDEYLKALYSYLASEGFYIEAPNAWQGIKAKDLDKVITDILVRNLPFLVSEMAETPSSAFDALGLGDIDLHQHQINSIITEVAELPDRTSPEGFPEAMLVTTKELRSILEKHLFV